jgi:hypothetical protein
VLKKAALEEARKRAQELVSEDSINIRVVKGKFYEKQDVFGQGDIYVRLKFDTHTFQTKVFNNSKEATFDEGIGICALLLM